MIRVLSYPPRHPYVDRLHPAAATLVHRDQAWPALADFYDPAWLARKRGQWQVSHLHFTFEQYPVDQFARMLAAHGDAGTPVVWTVHDLRNPHTDHPLADQSYHAVLAAHADAVLTLSPTVAEQVRRQFGREATVIPHGPVVDLRTAAQLRRRPRPAGPVTVLLHAKSGRRNLDVTTALAAVGRVRRSGEDLRVRLSVHHDVVLPWRDDAQTPHYVTVDRHAPWSDRALATAVADADALLLPYRWGTHSGLLELAHDVATAVIASDVGAIRDQKPAWLVNATETAVDVDALTQALGAFAARATAGDLPSPPSLADRAGELDGLITAHQRLYARASRGELSRKVP